MARAIDSEAAYRFLSEQLVKETGAFSKGVNKGLNIARSAMRNPDAIPTLTQPNEPLTLKQLREMNGQPVWVEEINHWALIDIETGGRWSGIPFVVWAENGAKFCYNIKARNLHCYRCQPKKREEMQNAAD